MTFDLSAWKLLAGSEPFSFRPPGLRCFGWPPLLAEHLGSSATGQPRRRAPRALRRARAAPGGVRAARPRVSRVRHGLVVPVRCDDLRGGRDARWVVVLCRKQIASIDALFVKIK